MKIILQFILVIVCTSTAFSQNKGIKHPVYPPSVSDIGALKQSVEPLMKMSIKEVIAQVPTKSGIHFVGCPNCNGGVQEGFVLSWKFGMGDKVQCNYCHMVFPNEKFPSNREKVIIAPSGIRQVYPYYENPEGRQYYLEPLAWYVRWEWMNKMAVQLATIWLAMGDNAYGDRAAAIAGRFAQVFPDYAVRYDYPMRPKIFFPANQKWPYEGLSPYRGAKWHWWAVADIPGELTKVYDILQSGYDWKRMDPLIGPETNKRVVRDMLRLAYEFTMANPVSYGNTAPGVWSDMIRLGRVLEDPSIVHEAVKRFREFFNQSYFADGWWKEGTTSYHRMTISGLKAVTDSFQGYTDPPDWKGERLDNPNLAEGIPMYKKALEVNRISILPNGRQIGINDTWTWQRGGGRSDAGKTDRTVSRLWPLLGDAAMGTGEGENQIVLNVNWSGNYGHEHYDNGAIILYAAGEELLPDIGYTQTKYTGWTHHTASHNTVVIDQLEQDVGTREKPATGRLKFYDDKDTHVKAIDLDASPAYSMAKTYRRRLVMVNAGPGRDYIVDRFDVEGGQDHDWFLHGMCEQEGTLETSIALDHPLATLVPDWGGKEKPQKQGDLDPKLFHAYVNLHDLKTGPATEKPWTATWRYNNGSIGLRTHNFSPAGTQVFRFRSPSVRPSGPVEDDNKVDDMVHSGIMQRNSSKASTFITVHEPFRGSPWIESVQNDGDALVVRYQLNGAKVEDRISIKEGEITVNSSAGWKYRSGTAHSGQVAALESSNGKWRLRLDREAPKVNYVRLDLTGGQTYYYPVTAVQSNLLELEYDPGFTIEADGKVRFRTFPYVEYAGPLRYTLFEQGL